MQTASYWLLLREEVVPVGEIDWLSPAERSCLARLRHPGRRREWLLGRWTVKCALRSIPVLPEMARERLSSLEVVAAASGAPQALWLGKPLPISLSISHRAGAAVCVVSTDGAVGCDLELVEGRTDAFLADVYTSAELAFVERTREHRDFVVNAMWSVKESVVKLRQSSIEAAARALEVEPSSAVPSATWQPFTVRAAAGPRYHGWSRAVDHLVLSVVSDPPMAAPLRLRLRLPGGGGEGNALHPDDSPSAKGGWVSAS